MSVKDEQIKWILSQYPASSEDNTEFCLRFWETAAEKWGVEFPESLKEIIRKYKPEAITRKRRELVDSTEEQRKKEKEFRNYYSG